MKNSTIFALISATGLRRLSAALLLGGSVSLAGAADLAQTVASGDASTAWNSAIWGFPASPPAGGNSYRVQPGLISSSATKLLTDLSVTGRVRAYSASPTFAGGSLAIPAQTELLLKDTLPATFTASLVLSGGVVRLSPNTAGKATLAGTIELAGDSHLGVVHSGASALIVNSTLTGEGSLRISAGDGDNNSVSFGGGLSGFGGTLDIGGGLRPVTVGFTQDYDLPGVHVLFATHGTADRFTLDHHLKFATFTVGVTALSPGVVYTAADLNALSGNSAFTGTGTISVHGSLAPSALRVVIVGDSTVATWSASDPEKGWGQMMAGFFDDELVIDNRAKPGASTKTFISQGLWSSAKSALRPGDYVLIQFGHNDAHGAGNPEATDAATDYRTYLQQYIDETRALGATPVLVTPMYRRSFDASGNLLPYLVDGSGNPYYDLSPYVAAMKQVARASDVTCLDLFAGSGELLRKLGNAGAIDLLAPNDVTHWNVRGATAMATLVVRALAASTEPLKDHLLSSWKPSWAPAAFAPGSSSGPYAPAVSEAALGDDDFALLASGSAATVLFAPEDAKVVEIAAGLFASDVERVGGVRPAVATSPAGLAAPVVVIGTIGRSPLIDGLISDGKLDVSAIAGTWERYRIEVVPAPWPGVPSALVIAGSDRRGTAYGVFSLSEAMGVSPWYWWADVPVRARSAIHVSGTPFTSAGPSVQYRGIFINDEDWGLQEWAEKNFESGPGEVRDIGPKTYAKVFEMLLRLRANYLWPAMHPSTAAFNAYADDKVVADDYAIVMGSSHAEPMLRNNVYEWSRFVDPANGQSYSDSQFHYGTNQGGVYRYWEQRAIANGACENVYTLGKRGIHDSGMVEGSGTAEKASWLNTIFAAQRQILSDHVDADLTQVAQIFVPYKEVLDIYDSGLVNVPADVALVWPDDNHGYIRRLSDPVEQLRPGGGGVYYHLSYWGAPADYLWLNSIPPALVWSEMTKAYQYNCSRLWVFNVGDIKPAEIALEFALRLAWDVNRYDEHAQQQWFTEWATREFGPEQADAIAAVLTDYHRLGYQRKPEHMNWADTDPLRAGSSYPLFSYVHHGDEAGRRLAAYADLVARAEALHAGLPADRRSAFFETVLYPVLGADGMNRKFLSAGRAYVAATQGRSTVALHNAAAQAGYNDILAHTATYNALEGGKWREMMDAKPRGLAVFNLPSLPAPSAPASPALGVAIEGQLASALNAPAATTITLNAVTDGTLTAPMQATSIAGQQAIWTPGSGTVAAAGAGGRATYTFNVPAPDTYQLAFEIHCPTADDDSWHIQIDGATPVVWNNLANSGVWTWTNYGTVTLTAGPHTLTVHQREDGAAMARIRLNGGNASVQEDPATDGFEFPEFNGYTRRTRFLDVFNRGTGSVAWTITTGDPWVLVSKSSGTTATEERIAVSIDWASAPRTGGLLSSVTVASAGQTLDIPVKVWNPSTPLAPEVDFVEEDGAVVIEAEDYSRRTDGTDARWRSLPGVGAGTGSMEVAPPTAVGRATIAEVVATSPCLEYRLHLRHSGSVTVTTHAIPTLPVTGDARLRYAVSFDDATPQLVDMTRSSGSGDVWSRSVLRSRISFNTTHTVAAPGVHNLKVWMVDPGVVIDRFVIATSAQPRSYDGPPETTPVTHGTLSVAAGTTVGIRGGETPTYDAIANAGTLDVATGGLLAADQIVNTGVLRLYPGAVVASGSFVNHGTLDVITWDGLLPPDLANDGLILDRHAVRAEGLAMNGDALEFQVHGYAGHQFVLEEAADGDLAGTWVPIDTPATGTDEPIRYSVEGITDSWRRFFRVRIDP